MGTTRRFRMATVGLAVLLAPLLVGAPAFAEGDQIAGFWNVHEQLLSACPTGDVVRDIPDLNILRVGSSSKRQDHPAWVARRCSA